MSDLHRQNLLRLEYSQNNYSAAFDTIESVEYCKPHQFSVLGVPISLVTMTTATRAILSWAQNKRAEYVCVRDVHGVKLSVLDVSLMEIHRNAGMVTPDGMPLVWLSRLRSEIKAERVCGADLMETVCREGQPKGVRHYFYGGKPGIAEKLAEKLKSRFPDMEIAGLYSPPFGVLTNKEDVEVVDHINSSNANIVWVGLSTPKQEIWMRDHVGRIHGATLIGVGAAFDFHSGAVKRAPIWMQTSGLEWVHRLLSEPNRLLGRYVKIVPWFLAAITREQFNILRKRL